MSRPVIGEHTVVSGGTVFCAYCGDILLPGSSEEPHGGYCQRAKAIVSGWNDTKKERCGYPDCSGVCGYCLDDLCARIRRALIDGERLAFERGRQLGVIEP